MVMNTIENKAKFFAQYWGQEVLADITNNGGIKLYPVDKTNMYRIEESHLLLTPLLQITDEYAIEVAKILFRNNLNSPYITRSNSYDFLRSKGYALPWMGVSVEQQVEYGWIKLKQ